MSTIKDISEDVIIKVLNNLTGAVSGIMAVQMTLFAPYVWVCPTNLKISKSVRILLNLELLTRAGTDTMIIRKNVRMVPRP